MVRNKILKQDLDKALRTIELLIGGKGDHVDLCGIHPSESLTLEPTEVVEVQEEVHVSISLHSVASGLVGMSSNDLHIFRIDLDV